MKKQDVGGRENPGRGWQARCLSGVEDLLLEARAMTWDKREIIGLLRLEIENIHRRGFGAYFRDSVLCLNAGLTSPHEKCHQCILLDFAPAEYRQDQQPCLHIPLDDGGNTVKSLMAQGRRRECEQLILAWMERTLTRLESQLAADRAAAKSSQTASL